MNFRDTIGHAIEAAATGAVGTAKSLMAYVKQLVTNSEATVADIGDFVNQTNLQSLLAALGIPDTAAKPLYTCLVTDRLDNGTYGLSAILAAITGAGSTKIATKTLSLETTGTVDIMQAMTQACLLKSLTIKMPTGAAGGTLTYVTIQSDDATAGVIFDSTDGAVANLTSEAELSWTGCMRVNVDTKIQLTKNGGHGSEYIATITAEYIPIVAGGSMGLPA